MNGSQARGSYAPFQITHSHIYIKERKSNDTYLYFPVNKLKSLISPTLYRGFSIQNKIVMRVI
jgi:hypothetical protein